MSVHMELLVEARNVIDERLRYSGLSSNRVVAIMAIVDAVLAETFGEEEAPGVAPATVEGSESRDAVVGASADGDHAVAAGAPGDLAPYELTGEQCVELATLLREAADAIGPRPSPLTTALDDWADTLTDAQPCGCGDVGCPECDNISAAERSHTLTEAVE